MINYSEYLTYDEFKTEILNMMFLKEKPDSSTNKKVFEELETNNFIFNSLPYKTARKILNENSDLFNCDLNGIYKGTSDIKDYKINFLKTIYEYTNKNSNKDMEKFLTELRKIFMDIIFEYSKTDILKMYSLDCFIGIKNYTIENSSGSNNYAKFFWDFNGYTFSRLQVNLTVNKEVGVNFLKNKCNFTSYEIKRLTDVSDLKTKFDAKILSKSDITKKVSDLSKKLSNYTNEINEFEVSETANRIKIISNYEYIKKIYFENTKTFLHLMDYNNQYRMSNLTKSDIYLYWHIKKKVESGDNLLTSEFIKEFKLKYTGYGKKNPEDVKRRFNSIENNTKDNGFRNLTIEQLNKYVTPQMVLDAIAINELSIISDTIYISDIETKYKMITNDLISIEIPQEKIKLVGNNNEDNSNKDEDINNVNNNEELKNKINEFLKIPNEITEKTPIDKYKTDQLLVVLKAILSKFISKHNIETEKENVISYNNSLIKLCNTTNNLRIDLKNNLTKLKEFYNNTFSNNNNGSYSYKNVVTLIENFNEAYEQMTATEAAKTYVLATGIIDEKTEILIKNNKELETFANSFLADNEIAKDETIVEVTNPISILFKNSDFLYLKELDYRNLEATLRMNTGIKPSELGCQRIWILIYLILNINARKNEVYNSKEETTEEEDFMSKVSSLLNKMRIKKWKFEYSDIEKHFSMLYTFVKYKQNPFAIFMQDEGFNQSQSAAFELRDLLENEREKLVESIKECVYGPNKLYDIVQGLADIMYELSTPISLYTDLSIVDAGENIINEFFNACLSSLEMQTAMTIYDFLFNFSININGKEYTLNSLNNILKMFSLIVEVSSNGEFNNTLNKYDSLAEYTSDYQMYKKIGFYTYNRDWENLYEIDKEILEQLTGYYLSDYTIVYNIIEYCRHKDTMCEPGNIKELTFRFNRLQEYEWIAIYASYLLSNKDKQFASLVIMDFADDFDLGYLNIQKIVDMLEAEAKNTDSSVTYIPPYIEDLGNSILRDDNEFNEFVYIQKNFVREFFTNINKNRTILKRKIVDKISDEKIIDWMMKMIPSYELIAQAFGFASLGGIANLEKFISSLMTNLNLMIKICFDRWKKETIEAMKTRQFQLIERERYYYIQSFPVIIDWVIKNLENYINTCSLYDNDKDIIDDEIYEDNMDRINEMSKEFVIALKEEIGVLNALQIEKFKQYLLSELVIIENFNRKDAEELIDKIFDLDNLTNIDLSKYPREISEQITNTLEKIIERF